MSEYKNYFKLYSKVLIEKSILLRLINTGNYLSIKDRRRPYVTSANYVCMEPVSAR